MTIRVPPDDSGKIVATTSLVDGGITVERQHVVLTGAGGSAEVAVVTTAGSLQVIFASPPTINNISATVQVSGGVAISGTAQVAIGTPFTVNNISATVTVSGNVNLSATASVILAAGAANIGIVNNISATVVVSGLVGLTAGTAVIGDLNAISRTVQVAIGTPFTLNNISATVTVAGNVNLSATASVILAAGTANFGTLNDISRTVQVAIGTPYTVNNISATVVVAMTQKYLPMSVQSASRGPRCIIASTSANVTLIAAPGAGLAVYVTMLAISNASGANTRARVGTSASIGTVQMMMAASGGGFVTQYDPPWKLSANEALLCSVKPNVSEGIFNCHFFVASADAL
ncbi:MAG: hypothetical protein [Podoviridae sp. ctQNx1]|nr:MAG: hypothetical protein [Podoviridae sp. ctQNx1]UOF78145.1 hypothetical protein [Caudoviricetes sp.]